jgi:hypothetical protein
LTPACSTNCTCSCNLATGGAGLRLFEPGEPARHAARLLAPEAFSTGVVHVADGPDVAPPTGQLRRRPRGAATGLTPRPESRNEHLDNLSDAAQPNHP